MADEGLPKAGRFVGPDSGRFVGPKAGGFVAPSSGRGFVAPEPEVARELTAEEKQVERWRVAWADLYALALPRPEHEEKRDAMFAWADSHGQGAECRAGQTKSVSFHAAVHTGSEVAFG